MKFNLDSASFVIYASYFEQFKILKMTDEEIGGVFKALNGFAVTGEAPEMDGFTPAQQAFLCNALQMTMANMKHSTNGKKGGRPAKNTDSEADEKKDPKPEAEKFAKPTIDELKAYIAAKGYTFGAEQFWNFYESKGWKVGNQKMKDWKACCVTWQKRQDGDAKKPDFDTGQTDMGDPMVGF